MSDIPNNLPAAWDFTQAIEVWTRGVGHVAYVYEIEKLAPPFIPSEYWENNALRVISNFAEWSLADSIETWRLLDPFHRASLEAHANREALGRTFEAGPQIEIQHAPEHRLEAAGIEFLSTKIWKLGRALTASELSADFPHDYPWEPGVYA